MIFYKISRKFPENQESLVENQWVWTRLWGTVLGNPGGFCLKMAEHGTELVFGEALEDGGVKYGEIDTFKLTIIAIIGSFILICVQMQVRFHLLVELVPSRFHHCVACFGLLNARVRTTIFGSMSATAADMTVDLFEFVEQHFDSKPLVYVAIWDERLDVPNHEFLTDFLIIFDYFPVP